jgi:hypothetical protein
MFQNATPKRLGNRKKKTFLKCGLADEEKYTLLYKDAEVTGLASLTKRRLNHYGTNMDQFETVPKLLSNN